MKRFKMITVCIPFMALMMGCHSDKKFNKLEDRISLFAEKYFNMEYTMLDEECTPESKRCLDFLCSQINERDLNYVKEKEMEVTHKLIKIKHTSDTTAFALLEVSGAYDLGDIGAPHGQYLPQSIFQIDMKKRKKTWHVDLKSPLRPRPMAK